MIHPRAPGDPLSIRASEWREISSTVSHVNGLRRSSGSRGQIIRPSASSALVKNTTGADLSIGHVVAIESPLFSATDNLEGFKRRIAMVATVPAATSLGRIAIASEPIADDAIGRVILSGIATVRLDVVDRNAWSAAPVLGATDKVQLVARGPLEVLHREEGDSGVVWAVVRIGAAIADATWIVVSSTLVSGSSPPRRKYTIGRGEMDPATGAITADPNGEEVYAYNTWENPTGWGNGQSLTPGGGITISPAPVEGVVDATFTGFFDPTDDKPIYRFHAPCPATSGCSGGG